MRMRFKRLGLFGSMGCLLVLPVHGSFYTEPSIFSTRPSETATMTSIDRFGPVGISIELHQPAFVMKIGNVEAGSPAAETGQLQRGQIIESINGEKLRDIDPRIQLGNIITQAEARDGVINILVREDEDSIARNVTVRIPRLGSYSPTWPLNCPKSNQIVRNLASWTARQQPNITTDGGMRMLFLLSTGDEQDLAVVRDWIQQLAQRHAGQEVIGAGVNWHLGYGAIPIAEYYLRTGDATALPLIRGLVRAAEQNYMPGGWSTRGLGEWRYMGGGRMSAAGVHVTTFLLLAQECGVDVDPNVLHGGLRAFIRFVGRGNVAYGDQRPESGYTDNGKNGAVAFTMAAAAAVSPEGENSKYAKARDMSAMRGFYSTHWMLHGHTGGGVGEVWRSAAMGLVHDAEAARYRSFMDQRMWFYELSRRFDGSFGILGGDIFGTPGRYDNTNWGVTMGLTYTVPRRTLRITGAPRTQHSQRVALPAQIWGTAADNQFYSLQPARPVRGEAPDVQGERLDGNSGQAIMNRISGGNEAVVRKYMHHPDPELRRSAYRRMGRMPGVVVEALGSEDARVRFAGVAAVDSHGSARTDETFDILLQMINNPDESWWVVDRALQALRHADDEKLKPHTDRLLYWARHADWWMSSAAIQRLMPLAAQGHESANILRTVGRVVASNQRFGRWRPRIFADGFDKASPEVQNMLLATLSAIYQSWPLAMDVYQDPQHPEAGRDFINDIAGAIARQEGGLDRLYELSQQRFPDRTLAHRDLFLGSRRLEENPAMRERLQALTRDELIPEFVVANASRLMQAYDHPDHRAEGTLLELISLYRRIGVQTYDWHDYGPERTEMVWDYHTFDPVEQPPVGRERNRLGRYRAITFPAGMENWNQPDFDAAAAGWKRGLAPFASLRGELRAVGGCRRDENRGYDFCGCGEQPNTLWDKEVLLIRGTFEIPPFEDGYLHQILVGGSSHVGFGDGTHIYANGHQLFRSQRAVDRREGARRIGASIGRASWSHFESGRTHLAARSFLKHFERGHGYGNYLTIFLRRMQIPPLWDEMIKGLQLTGMRSSAWQELQDPDTNVDPADGLYIWNGQIRRNAEAVGSWKAVDQVDAIASFDPTQRQRPSRGWRPVLDEIQLAQDLRTSAPLFVWTGSTLLDVHRKEALAVEHAQVGGKDYLFVETGGFSPDRAVGWKTPWLVFEKQ